MTTCDVSKADITQPVKNNNKQLIISLSVNVLIIGIETTEQGQFTKLLHGNTQPANTLQFLYMQSETYLRSTRMLQTRT